MLRKIFWLLFLVAACTPAQRGDVSADAGSVAGTTDRNAPLVSDSIPTVISVSPDHGESGDVVTITGSGFGLDPRGVRVRIGGALVEITNLRETGDGYQQIEVELTVDTVSGPVSVYAADQWTTFPDTFCAQPVIHDLTLFQADENVTVQINGSNFDPFAVVYVGDTPQEAQRLLSGRRPHQIEPTLLFITVQPNDHGTVWVENHCPDGRSYTATSSTMFWQSTRD
ncbi:MAG: IPT/TIG domain-containing protein [Anaerolineae bacterium]|nr:IPT/TIG domain-containing protein [Anaerolineae bacterium]